MISQRLLQEDKFQEGLVHLKKLATYCSKHSLHELRLKAESLQVEVFIKLQDYSQAAIILSAILSKAEG